MNTGATLHQIHRNRKHNNNKGFLHNLNIISHTY